MEIKKKIIIKGTRVHDVGYRLFLLDEAEAQLIPYLSAKNIKNEAQVVEVLAGGEEDRIENFIEFVKNTFPDDAEVDSVYVEDYAGDIRTIESFSRSFSISQLSKIARTGVAMLGKQDVMIEKQDTMLGKMDSMLGKQDETTKAIKDLSGRVEQGKEEIVTEISSLKDDLKSHFDERLSRLVTDVSQIKAKVSM